MAENFKRGEHPYRLRGVCPEDGIKGNKNTRDRQTDRHWPVFLIHECLRKIQG